MEIFAEVKILHRYLARQVGATIVMTVIVFTFIILLANVVKEILGLIANQQASLSLIIKAVGYLIPYVLSFSLPMGMLTAALLTFGRFSSDQELTAARASGLSLISLVTPVLIMSVILSGFCAWLNFEISPRCRVAYRELITNAGLSRPTGILRANQFVEIKKYTIYVEKIADDGIHVENVRISQKDEQDEMFRWIKAPLGTFTPDLPNHRINVKLTDAYGEQRDNNSWSPMGNASNFDNFNIDLASSTTAAMTIPISDMTLRQLWSQYYQIKNMSGHELPATNSTAQSLTEKQIHKMTLELAMPVIVQIHREISFSFACIGFTLIGIPLGIRAHRRETSAGVAIALGLVLLYYSFIIIAQAWQHHPERFPWLVMWLPNFIFQFIGGFLLWRANRGV